MKTKNRKLLVIFIAACLALPVYSETSGLPLLLKQSPPDGGNINIDCGVHQFDYNTLVPLKAAPKQGWKFVYWLGDVSDSTSTNTFTILDSPKMIIAVYEREYSQFQIAAEGGGGISPQSSLTPNQKSNSQSNIQPAKNLGGSKTKNTKKNETVPEPATIALLGMGTLFLYRKSRTKPYFKR